MRRLIPGTLVLDLMLGVAVLALASPSNAARWQITEIIDATGDGGGNPLDHPWGVTVNSSGNVYVTGLGTDNAFKIQSDLQVPALSNGNLAVLAASLLCAALWLARQRRYR